MLKYKSKWSKFTTVAEKTPLHFKAGLIFKFPYLSFHLFLQQTLLRTSQQYKVKNNLADAYLSEDLYNKHTSISGCLAISAYLAACIWLWKEMVCIFSPPSDIQEHLCCFESDCQS